MNWVDIVIILILLFFAIEGMRKPLFFQIFDLLGFIFSFLISLRFYNFAAGIIESLLNLPHSFANVLGFIIVWYLVETLMFFVARAAYRLFSKVTNFPGEKALSAIPAVLKGVVFVAIILVLVAVFPIQPKVKKDVKDSKLGSWILTYTYKVESPLKSVFGGFSNDTLSFLTIQPKTRESVGLGFKNDEFVFDEVTEFKMIDLVNRERMNQGLQPLIFDLSLRQIARGHSADMFLKGYFAHYDFEGKNVADRAIKNGVEYQVVGENLAYAPSLELAHQGLMNSPGHRANILSGDFNRVGIGIADGDEYGLMITQVFKN